jgi:hypothetical protein
MLGIETVSSSNVPAAVRFLPFKLEISRFSQFNVVFESVGKVFRQLSDEYHFGQVNAALELAVGFGSLMMTLILSLST